MDRIVRRYVVCGSRIEPVSLIERDGKVVAGSIPQGSIIFPTKKEAVQHLMQKTKALLEHLETAAKEAKSDLASLRKELAFLEAEEKSLLS